MKRFCLLGLLVSFAAAFAPASAQDRSQGRALPASLEGLKLEAPLSTYAAHPRLGRDLVNVTGPQQIVVRLEGAPVARGGNKADIQVEQAQFIQRCGALPGARIIAQVDTVLNAVFLEIDASHLAAVAGDPAVRTIKKVANYELDLSETVPYIGGSTVQSLGADGEGISVAVLDSGVDYTHANLGGAGTLAAYAAAYGAAPGDPLQTTRDGLFPTAKVVEGYDFVGEVWPNGPGGFGPDDLAPDPDPIDFDGHGSHVADIIAGARGVAPGADLWAVKVCSAVSGSCSGIALIQGMDFAVDPNGDGDLSDRVDIINMSLGSSYGSPFNDDLSAAVDNATAVGVLTVSSAGNGADKPYIQGSPSGAPTAISVAQTAVPSADLQLIDVPPVNGVPAVFQPWSAPPAGVISAPTVYGGSFGSALGCSTGGNPNDTAAGTEPYPPGTFSGEIVLVDRGACNFSIKIFNIQRGGGSAGIIGLVAPGAPFAGGLGNGGPFTIPGYMISQADSLAIQGVVPTGGTIDSSNRLPLVMSMVGSSSRGPQGDDNRIKPEIGAPGASVSAIAGTGDLTGPFGGTSGASPMVAGSAALVLDCRNDQDKKKKPSKKDITLVEAKSLLMNTAAIDILNDATIGDLAPISRIGGGEVRVDRAAVSASSAWDNDDPFSGGALSFGQVDVADGMVHITKTVRVRNRSSKKITYEVIPTFRTPGPEGSGAISVSAPSYITVKGNKDGKPKKDTVFDVTLTIDGSLLPGNFMNSGSEGANGAALTANEFDGYLLLEPVGDDDSDSDSDSDSGSSSSSDDHSSAAKKLAKTCKKNKLSAEPIHVAWHVLPRKAARVVPERTTIADGFLDTIALDNTGVGTAQLDTYELTILSPNLPEGGQGAQSPTPDFAAIGVTTFPVPAGFCSAQESFVWVFAFNSHERQRHLVQPVSYQVWLDTDPDAGNGPDWVVLNRDLTFNGVGDGRQVSWAFDLVTGDTTAFFFAEHATNTGNTALTICGEQVGLTGTDMAFPLGTGTEVEAFYVAQDFYFGGPSDLEPSDGSTVTLVPYGERFEGLPTDIPGNSSGDIGIRDWGFYGNTSTLGLMMFSNGDRGAGARGGATEGTETIIFTPE